MHTKQTVRYICEKYPSGNDYYFKQEMITSDSWENLSSLLWGSKRPITGKTFKLRQKQGYKCTVIKVNKLPAEVTELTPKIVEKEKVLESK